MPDNTDQPTAATESNSAHHLATPRTRIRTKAGVRTASTRVIVPRAAKTSAPSTKALAADQAKSKNDTAGLDPAADDSPSFPVLRIPANGVPELTNTEPALQLAWDELLAGCGPLSIDTERAQGFRYTAKAYLIQLRRGKGKTILLDPVAFEHANPRADFSKQSAQLADIEWIIHAATNDMPCLVEVGLVPRRLFDTELAGRLLGIDKVNLCALMEQFLGVSLAKQHSAEDWSTRPVPKSWRAYAALDVERLADLRDALEAELKRVGRYDIAQQEFAHLVAHALDPVTKQSDPWRKTSGIHTVKSRRSLAVLRSMWEARDAIAANTDTAPGRIINDKALAAFAASLGDAKEVTAAQLRKNPTFRKRDALTHLDTWVAAANSALALKDAELPPKGRSKHGQLHQLRWKSTAPELYSRYQRIRGGLDDLSAEIGIPTSNLLAPDDLRRLIWDCRHSPAEETYPHLSEIGVREWQQEVSWGTIAINW